MYIDYYKQNHNIIPSPAWSLVLNRGGFFKMAFLRVRSASDAAVQSVRYWFLLTPRDARAHMRDPGISVLVKKVNWF